MAASFVGASSSRHVLSTQHRGARRRLGGFLYISSKTPLGLLLGSTMMGHLLGEDMERLRQVSYGSSSATYSKITSLNLSDNQLGVLGAKCLAVFLDPEITQYSPIS